jgi:hypothetical protein
MASASRPDAMVWDGYVVQFEAIISLADTFLKLSILSSPCITPLPTFSLDKGMI